ncbi:MAG TPA: DNA polymerase III subunit alpha, partial [Dehalococcoidia bacterium]
VTLTSGHHLTLLCASREGYGNLCRLLTAAHARGKDDPALDPALLARHAAGLIVLTGCPRGEVPALLAAGREEEAAAALRRLLAWFGPENVSVELQRQYVRGEAARNRRLVALARRLGVPLVATNTVHYHVRERHRLQDVLVAIRGRTTLDGCHQERRPNDEFYLKAPQEMARLFADLPEAVAGTVRVAERCAFDLTRDLGYRFPDFQNPRDEPADEALARVCREALAARYPPWDPHRKQAEARLAEELALVRRHGLAGFFLVYRDLLDLAGQVAAEVRGPESPRALAHLPPGRGRGSSVSSIICYLIGLSHVDPVRHNLSLGRFLNEALASVPDIDLDFPRDIREELIKRVMARYGHEHAALVCSFATYRFRSAVRDVGKALGLPATDLDKLAKLGDRWDAGDVAAELARVPELASKAETPAWRHLVALTREIAGLPRHVSQHVGGMIIASQPLVELVPVEPARMAGRFVVQWDKDSCDDARFIKVDFLALGMLSAVEECLEHIAAQGKPPVDLARLDYADPAVYAEICRGDTVGLFQIESRAQIQMLPRVRPQTLDDLAVQVALVRPGPIVGGAVHPYVTRRARELRWRARWPDRPFRPPVDHPRLASVLGETLGIILFQDQVLEVARALAGFTAGQAESLRRAMSRRRSRELMLSFWREFRDGCARNGVDPATARTVFKKLVAFSAFGFPKSHAAAFAVLAYQSAWLRRYYPAEFYCAL